jgi:plasmid stability protein
MILPAWMQQAIRDRVIDEAEAREIHRICLESDQEEVPMPVHLNNACERILLWELEAPPTIQ